MTRGRPDDQRVYPVPAKHIKELVIVLGTELVTQKQRTSLKLVRDINTATNDSEDTIITRYFVNRDILVVFQGVPKKQKQEAYPEVFQVFGIGTRFCVREYIVLVYSIQVRSVNQADQVEAITNIYIQNPQLKDIVYIIRVSQAKRILKSGKRIAILYISITKPKQANYLIDIGLFLDSELYNYKLFDSSYYIIQYFRYYQYNYITKYCKSIARYSFCSTASHNSQDYSKKDNRVAFYCIPCYKQDYMSWAREYLVRK